MITDDHKSSEKSTEAAAKAAAAAAAAVGLPAPQHIAGSPAGSRAGSTSGRGPKVLIMPSNPPSSIGNGAKKGANGHHQAATSAPASTSSSRSSSSGNGHPVADGGAKYRGSTAPLSSAASAYAASTAPTSRTHTNGTVSPSFAAAHSVTSSALATAVGTPLPASLPLPRGTKRAAVRSNGESSSLSPNEDDSSSTSSDTTRHHQARKQRTAAVSSSTPYDRRSSPAGSSLSGASSVLGTPHFPSFGMSTALPQMEDPDDGSFDFALEGGLDRRAGTHLPAFSANSPPSASAIGLAGLATGDNALLCDPSSGEMRIELGSVDDMLFTMEARPDESLAKTRSPTLGLTTTSDGCDASDAYHRTGGSFYRPTFVRTGSDADMSFDTTSTADNEGELEAMSFDSLVDYEGGSSCATGSAFSPPASGSTSSRRETSASSGTSSDSDSLLGGAGLATMAGPHSHWPSIYPSALNNPNDIQISYPHSYVVPTPPPPPPPPLPRPSISRLIPAEGPLAGGIEITLLGVNFLQGMVAFFGENRAPMTSCWNDGTIVCTVPPGIVAGSVPVVLRMEGRSIEGPSGTGGQLFTYKDASDRALCVSVSPPTYAARHLADSPSSPSPPHPAPPHPRLELALQVVGLKMTGRIEDAKNVALRILGQGSFATNVPTSSAANTASGSSAGNVAGNVAALDAAPSTKPSEKTTLQRIQSTYESAAISMTGRSKYQIPPLAVSQDDKKQQLATAAESTQLAPPQTKEKPPSWAAATAAQARRLTEREIARYGHHSARKSGKGGKYDKMYVFALGPSVARGADAFGFLALRPRAGSGSSGCRSSSALPSSSPSRTCPRSSATSSGSAAATCR